MSLPLRRTTPPLLLVLAAAMAISPLRAQELSVPSPDGHIQALLNPAQESASYRVLWDKQVAILPSPFGISVDGQDLAQNLTLQATPARVVRETYPIHGGHSVAQSLYRETIFAASGGPNHTSWQVEVRVFNDGVAIRYRVPGTGKRHVDGEATGWKLPPGSVTWAQKNTSNYESAFVELPLESLTPDAKIGAPLVAKIPGGSYALLSEANVVNYSDMALQVGSGGSFHAIFDKDATGWTADGEIVSPWRVTLLARDLTALVNSDIVHNLCPPPAPELQNAAWIVPGRSTWQWMVTQHPVLKDQHRWVDWTKQLGFDYYLIDDGWRDWRDGDRDAWANLKEVADYAKSQNVKIWAWVNSREVFEPQARLAYFQKAREVGLVGLKIDFPGRPNVEWVNWYDDTLRDAAAAHLMLDFHGAVKPTGRDRTWPNELTREAILGRESGKLPATHDTALPFTRYVQGSADYTPTDFRQSKLNGSSWARELAQAVVYTSPLLCLSGSPENYLSNPGLDVLRSTPATWDQTVVLPDSEIGRTAAFARRKGNTWFVGVVNGNEARPFRIDLNFLGKGRFHADLLADSSERNDAYNRTTRLVSSRDNLSFYLRRDGGFVARFTPVNP